MSADPIQTVVHTVVHFSFHACCSPILSVMLRTLSSSGLVLMPFLWFPPFPHPAPFPGTGCSAYHLSTVHVWWGRCPSSTSLKDPSLVAVEFKTTASECSVSAGAGWVENLPVVCFSTISSWFTEYIVAVLVNNFWWAFAFQLFICGLLAIVIVIVLQWCQI